MQSLRMRTESLPAFHLDDIAGMAAFIVARLGLKRP